MLHTGLVIVGLWLGFIVSWLVAFPIKAKAVKRAGMWAQTPYNLVMLAGLGLLLLPTGGLHGMWEPWPVGRGAALLLVALTLVGFAFAWWARLTIGMLWSGSITRKPGHRVVNTGPYSIVRHPIYTGWLLAIAATACAKESAAALAGAGLIILAVWMKARMEEAWLRTELGQGAYEKYASGVPMLVPTHFGLVRLKAGKEVVS